MTKKRMLSRAEVVKAYGLFKEHLHPSERSGYWKYEGDWDDTKIAQLLDPTIQINVIARLRVELFGQIDTVININREDNAKLKELEILIGNILNCYGELEIKFNKLVETLALNKVANVIHLKTTMKEKVSG